ncbi:MAG TPA: biotin/lipoyl-binding protein, partial [Lacipirellulaceae bacterium]|nr:biotin/lipoyl-binding protein [Lacipirellulaceae bacterium]
MYGAIVLIIAAFGQTSLDPAQFPAPAAAASTPAGDPVIDGLVHAQNDVRVFAEVEGLLTTLNVREGSRVSAGQVIATIDD